MLKPVLAGAVLVALLVFHGGCSKPSMTCPRVVFLDGAGWYAGDGPVRQGLKDAGYRGEVERFGWSLMMGPLADHALAGPEHFKTDELAGRITDLRRANPDGHIAIMGLSSGCSMIVYALEKLTADVKVDEVVLLSPSTSGRTDLREALSHVKGSMYVTVSPLDYVLAIGESSGPEGGDPAGRMGFMPPADLALDEDGRGLYNKVVHIYWQEKYRQLGWAGGHTGATSPLFIQKVIAPKIMPSR
jgi:hypothetical protein